MGRTNKNNLREGSRPLNQSPQAPGRRIWKEGWRQGVTGREPGRDRGKDTLSVQGNRGGEWVDTLVSTGTGETDS